MSSKRIKASLAALVAFIVGGVILQFAQPHYPFGSRLSMFAGAIVAWLIIVTLTLVSHRAKTHAFNGMSGTRGP